MTDLDLTYQFGETESTLQDVVTRGTTYTREDKGDEVILTIDGHEHYFDADGDDDFSVDGFIKYYDLKLA